MKQKIGFWGLWLCVFFAQVVRAQTDSLMVRQIHIECHNKTKEHIITRELALKPGSKVARQELDRVLEQENNKIFNTNLFVSTNVYPQEVRPGVIDLIISVEEQWYLWAVPILELADRNFNEWWTQRDRSLSRLEYGIRFKQKNFRGRNENLLLLLQLGFTRKAVLDYQIPYISRKQRTGLRFKMLFAENTSVAHQTNDHFLDFVDSSKVMLRRFNFSTTLSKRFNFYASHHFRLSYGNNRIADTVADLNPDFFLEGRTRQQYIGISYQFIHDFRDRAPYPLKGHLLQASVTQRGLGFFNDLSLLTLEAYGAKYTPLSERWFLSNGVSVKLSLPERQPYFQREGLGYGRQFVRGFDLLVIDGQRHFLSRNTVKFQLFSFTKEFKKVPILRKFRQFRRVPVAAYLKAYSDGGYVYDNDPREVLRPLRNTWLHNFGIGLDFVTYYNFVMRFEYSFANKPEAGGFFINLQAGI